MTNSMIVGIDPGLGGAMAAFGGSIPPDDFRLTLMPTMGDGKARTLNLVDIVAWLSAHRESPEMCVWLEKVHSMPGQGVASSFKFGRGVGQIEGLCAGLGISLLYVTPQAWKKQVLEGMNWKGNKECSIEYVRARYPLLQLPKSKAKANGISDAICIALYGRWKGSTHLQQPQSR